MLKRLELLGFKSFADKTVFEFAPGLTAVVGPNGSGKSNVVDAVRWLLGEQSAKSLRGGEMTDVIFNGSSTRKSLGMAEVTMVFDNRPRSNTPGEMGDGKWEMGNEEGPAGSSSSFPISHLPAPISDQKGPLNIQADEVQVTRRVYRDGVGEYLINGRPCRLKDVKDLFLGSGAGAHAYSIIEQGRVDALLQASPVDRRAIFEEAAGISRFKAKKVESLRRLERVETNLQRLADIIAEVDKQLRSVKLAAGKARSYQEYTARLRELRVAVGLHEYHELTTELTAEEAALADVRRRLAESMTRAELWDSDARSAEEALGAVEAALRAADGRLAAARQRIAGHRAALASERTAAAELGAALLRARQRTASEQARAAAVAASAHAAASDYHAEADRRNDQAARVADLEAEQAERAELLESLRRQEQADGEELFEWNLQETQWRNEVVQLEGKRADRARERDAKQRRSEETLGELGSIDLELAGLEAAEGEAETRLATAKEALAANRRERERLRAEADRLAQVHAELRAQRSGLASRVEVLEGLERSLEGLGTGVREVLGLLAAGPDGADADPLAGQVVGLVADLLTVPRELAPLIDLALGDAAQRFVVRDGTALDAVLRSRAPLAGRVSFLPLAGPTDDVDAPADLTGHAAEWAAARADRLVRCERPDLAGLPERLLGRTLVVANLAAARAGAARLRAAGREGYRFVTRAGELLEADGTLTVGAHHAEAGILSRKSELRELRAAAEVLDQRIVACDFELAEVRERAEATEAPAWELEQEIAALGQRAGDLRERMARHKARRDDLRDEVEVSRGELGLIVEEIAELEEKAREAKVRSEDAGRQLAAVKARLAACTQALRTGEADRQRAVVTLTEGKVALGQMDERLRALADRYQRLDADHRQRLADLAALEGQAADAATRLAACELAQLAASAGLADAHRELDAAESEAAGLAARRDAEVARRRELSEQAQAARGAWQALQDEAHGHDLRASELRHRRDAAAARLAEDYQVDLAAEYAARNGNGEMGNGKEEEPAAAGDPGAGADATALSPLPFPISHLDSVQEEIAELRRKLSRLGSVNLEALDELVEVERRAAGLQSQFDDLAAARDTLTDIITRINTDSRRLFTETFAAVRAHFQELFRKLFGGGMADVVPDNPDDLLESGLEIVARPPGKELRSISLMSGGEKTMTAVALLLAIFRSKPSPFCLLDEVDAALDEANTERLSAVLREFLVLSQFIIITHHKRTMAAADVLYGVTMQESGVSRRVAVRFEDWPDDEQATLVA
jgi:chromosome segregation protein